MDQLDLLRRDFARAGVALKITDGPFANANRAIVQMDVSRDFVGSRVRERILLWPGVDNALRVTGVEPRLNQLVLGVTENVRTFVVRQKDPETGKVVKVERKTTAEPRRFLVGMDEAHLFVAQLSTAAETVAEAHRGLRPKALDRRQPLCRQGEWFFVPITEAERGGIHEAVRRGLLRRDVPLGALVAARGRPHVVSELVRLRDEAGTRFDEFVRGLVRHPDHKTIELGDWVRVFVNTENRSVGATWVD